MKRFSYTILTVCLLPIFSQLPPSFTIHFFTRLKSFVLMFARTPDRPDNPQAVGKGQEIAEKTQKREAEQLRADIAAEQDGRADNQSRRYHAHG